MNSKLNSARWKVNRGIKEKADQLSKRRSGPPGCQFRGQTLGINGWQKGEIFSTLEMSLICHKKSNDCPVPSRMSEPWECAGGSIRVPMISVILWGFCFFLATDCFDKANPCTSIPIVVRYLLYFTYFFGFI